MKELTLLLIFLSSTNLNVESAALVDNQLQEDVKPRSLTYLGNVGTKQFFVGDSLETWQEAVFICWASGLNLVTIKSEAEKNFVAEQLMTFNRGPFWFGARDIGNKSMFRWTDSYSAPYADDPATMLGTFVNYYNYVEQGPLALQMNAGIGPSLFGAHALQSTAKAFCQT